MPQGGQQLHRQLNWPQKYKARKGGYRQLQIWINGQKRKCSFQSVPMLCFLCHFRANSIEFYCTVLHLTPSNMWKPSAEKINLYLLYENLKMQASTQTSSSQYRSCLWKSSDRPQLILFTPCIGQLFVSLLVCLLHFFCYYFCEFFLIGASLYHDHPHGER